ncbi:hypothetical protein SUDANB140_06486 [Streptomyces sp. enrichment culture]
MSGSYESPGSPVEGLPRHGLPPRHFDSLAGGGGGRVVIAHLWDSERSHRLFLLGLLTALVRERPDVVGPLSAVDDAWNLLIAAERHSAAIADEMLLLPETGRWLRHSLQRLQEPYRVRGVDEPPLWADVGHLHLLAAALAVRVGLPFRLRGPCRAGQVWFPALGRAAVRGDVTAYQAVDIAFADDTLTVALAGEAGRGHAPVRVEQPPSKPSADWQVPRFLPLEVPEGPRAVGLYDMGAYRMRSHENGTRPATEEAIRRWTDLLRRAWSLLARVDPSGAEDVSACLRSIEPLPAARPFRWLSATMEDGMGGMAASEPTGAEPVAAAQFAAVLTHEAQHSKLSALLHMYSLHRFDTAHRFYAPWRDDPRPLRGMLHGLYAFTGVARFWRGHLLNGCDDEEAGLTAFEFALRRHQLMTVLPTVLGDTSLTDLGRRLVGRLLETVGEWHDEPVPPVHRADAEQTVEDHGMSWRASHLLPDEELVGALARHWGARRTLPDTVGEGGWRCPEPRLVPDPEARQLDARAVLTRMRLVRSAAEQLRSTKDVHRLVVGARPADVHLLDGDLATAEDLYAAEIRAQSATPRPAPGVLWAGLARAMRGRPHRQEAMRVLTAHPEVVRHVYARISEGSAGPPDPVAVADWLGRTAAAP